MTLYLSIDEAAATCGYTRRMAGDGLRVSSGTAHKARRYVRGEAGR